MAEDSVSETGKAARRGRKRHWLRIVAALVVVAACAVLVYLVWRQSFRVICIKPLDGGVYHRAVAGREVILKAVVRAPRGANLEYEWDFGDGGEPVRAFVSDPYNLGIRHGYGEPAPGTKYKARLTVSDIRTGEKHSASYRVRFYESTPETLGRIAREDGLWALHTSMVRDDKPGTICRGYLKGAYPVGVSAIGALAFQLNGYTSAGDRRSDPYVETVDRAMTYVMGYLETTKIAAQPAGDPDGNGNGQGLYRGGRESLYETPIVALAVIADGAPERLVRVGNQAVDGRSFREVVRDMVDFLAFAQTEEGNARGGWRYTANKEADMSVTQWPVMALFSAEEVLGIRPPQWVRTELLDHWLAYAQAESGAFGYTDPTDTSPARTAAGLVSLAFCGLTAGDARVQRAIEAVGAQWPTENVGNTYTMYSVMKAAMLTRPGVERFGEHDWRDEYRQHLFKSQDANGFWPRDKRADSAELATAWGVLILTPRLFAAPRIPVWWWLVAALVTAAAALLYWRRRRSRRGRTPPAETDQTVST